MVFPPCLNTSASTMLFPGLVVDRLIRRHSRFLAAVEPMYSMPGVDVHWKRFIVFDQSTSRINPAPIQAVDLQGSNETNVTVGNRAEEEMHEDAEEIDILLYSDSEEGFDEEEASTGQSPANMAPGRMESVACSVVRPTKKRRLNSGNDTSLLDTASSAGAHLCNDAETRVAGEQEVAVSGSSGDHRTKQLKRERILETVSLLRKIIPGMTGKDTVSVLDEAISYLKYLKLKAEALKATSM